MSSYSEFADRVGRIEQHTGDVQANATANRGSLIGSTIATLGNSIPKQVQEAISQAAERRKQAQIQSILQQHGGDVGQAAQQIMTIDPKQDSDLLNQWSKVQETLAQADKIDSEAQSAREELSNKLLMQVRDEDSYAHWAIVAHKLGDNPPPQFDKDYVQQRQSALKVPEKPIVIPRGGTLASPEGTVLAKGEAFPEPQPTEASLAMQAAGGDPAKAMTILKPPPDKSITPYQQAQLDLAKQRLAVAIKNGNKAASSQAKSGMADAVIAHPELFDQLTATEKGAIIPELNARGFSDFGKPPSATLENRLASAQAVTQTGNDIIRQLKDPKVAAMLGPAMGRYNSVLDFVGNPPPEFANLAGLIESYSLANMGVHGMRSSSGAEAIKQTLGVGRHTPASIITTIEGLNGFANHLIENEDPKRMAKPSGSSAAPSAPSGGLSYQDYLKSKGGK